MAVLTPQQIAGVARTAGFTGAGLQWAVAVALAESGGRTDAVGQNHDKYNSVDRGLWQINSYWHKEVTAAAAFDPAQAAAAAFRISKRGTDWSQWATAKNGTAAAQLGRASLAAASPTSSAAAGAENVIGLTPIPILPKAGEGAQALGDSDLGQSLGGAAGVADSLSAIGKASSVLASGYLAYLEWITTPHNVVRIVYVGLGAAGALAGLIMLSQSGVEGPLGSAGQAAASATGKAGKAVKNTAGLALTAGSAVATGGTTAAVAGTAKVGGAAVKAAKVAKAVKAA